MQQKVNRIRGKRIYRSEERMIGGVCGGLAEYLEVDPTVVRVLWVLGTFFTGFVGGIMAYLVSWILMPEQD